MAELVKAWGREVADCDGGEKEARACAERAARQRMRDARLLAIDDVSVVKTESRASHGVYYYRCQAAVRAVKG